MSVPLPGRGAQRRALDCSVVTDRDLGRSFVSKTVDEFDDLRAVVPLPAARRLGAISKSRVHILHKNKGGGSPQL